MKLQEEKAAEVRKRWDEIQQAKEREARKPSVPMSKPPADKRPALNSGMMRDMAKQVASYAGKRSDEMTPDEKKQLEENQKRDHAENIADLKEPIEWFGKVAVGASKSFPGWWKVVPPVGFTISYMGKTARDQAIAQAKTIREYYE